VAIPFFFFGFTHSICSYEFAPNEFVNALESVTLETLSTESGTKDFIAIGTTINRGEDLAVKGAVSISSFVSHIHLL
jgi:cleavage and polyadenylation specificity factor subunit 1